MIFFMACSITCIAQESPSAGQLYNQGNAQYESGSYGDAVYFYERAHLLDPSSSAIETNLILATEKLESDIISLEPFFLSSWWGSLSGLMSPGGWKVLSILILLGMVLVGYFLLVKRAEKRNPMLLSSGAILLVLFTVCVGTGYTRQHQIFDSPFGILSSDATSLLIAPDPISEGVKKVVGGVKVEILDMSGGYYKVATMDKEQGWIEKVKVRRLAFSEKSS